MNIYNFNVLNRDETVAAIQSVILGNSRAIWPKVAELAWSVGEAGGQIRVTDRAGSVVVLVGVNSAAVYPDFQLRVRAIPPGPHKSIAAPRERRARLANRVGETAGAEEPQLFLI